VPPAEGTVFVPGDRDPLVRFDGHAAAVAVCADTGRPSHPDAAAQPGSGVFGLPRDRAAARVILVPAPFDGTPSELEEEHAKLRGYAARHSMAVVLANFGGPSGGLASGAGSAIWSEEGELLARLPGGGRGLAIAIEDGSGSPTTSPR